MKKNIHRGYDFSQLGGFPINQQRLEWMQTAYAELSGGLAALFGDNTIVSGCIVNGNNVSDGWIVYDGELLPFIGTQTGVLDTFLIREAQTPLTFKDSSQKNVQFSRFAQFGTSDNTIPWDNLRRLPSLASMAEYLSKHLADKDNPHKVTKAQVGLGNLPNAVSDSTTLASGTTLATSKAVSIVASEITKLSKKLTLKRYTLSVDRATGFYEGILDTGYSLDTGIFTGFGSAYPFGLLGWVWYENGNIKYKFEKRNADSMGNFFLFVLYVTQ
jgi:hypothetical protein